MRTYRHSPIAHLLGIGFPVAMCWLACRTSVAKLVNAGEAERIALVGACVLLGLFAAWLYWKSSINRYQISDEGLVILRWRSSKVIPWAEIDEIVWKRLPHCVFIKGKGQTLVFTSTDFFDDLPDLLREIVSHSKCKLSPNLIG